MNVEGVHQIAISTPNFDETIEFYQHTFGLPLVKRFDGSPTLAFFDIGGVRLMIESNDEAPAAAMFYLRVDDIDEMLEKVKAGGGTVESEPIVIFRDDDGFFGTAGESEYLAFIRDPGSTLIGLMQRK